ncbi:FYRN-domain-containing protein, partial [Thelephora terrestris]
MSIRASSSGNTPMGPPADRDVVMAPPQFNPQQFPPAQTQPANVQQKPPQDYVEKYKRLKRKFFELEEKFKETESELLRSSERTSRMRHDQNALLDRIIELEQQVPKNVPRAEDDVIQARSSAFPRSLLPKKAQDYFRANMRVALEESSSEDPKLDPIFYSRHVGPQARKQQEEELTHRAEEEAREARRQTKRARTTRGKEANAQGQVFPYHPSPGHDPGRGGNQPYPGEHPPGDGPLLVSSNGTRLRIKPPVPPSEGGGSISHQSSGYQPSPTVHQLPGDPQFRGRSGSPMSQSPHEEQPFTFIPNGASGDVPPPMMNDNSTASRVVAPSRAPENQRLAKPKRLKAHTVLSKSHSIPVVPRDKTGKPLLPLNVGIMTVINLGEVCKREHFHTERYIFPVGYEVTRRYLSTIDPNAEVVYHCSILDGGDGPKFQIVAGDNPTKPIIAGTATGAWSMIVKTANQIRNRQHSNSVSGPDFFGLAQNTIKHLIQGLPAADQLRDYVWQSFHEGGPLGGRHASVVPALPDE